MVIGFSFIIALVLSIFPLPLSWGWFRPEFVALVAIYWAVVFPQYFGIGYAWVIGMIQDVVEYSLLGQHALSLIAVVYICHLSYQRIRNYALWQQAAWVFIFVGIHQLFWNWVHSLQGSAADPAQFLLPALASALAWPMLLIVMEWVRLRFRIQ